ncbi:MAG: ribonuclease R [Alphaproteobacteria bacterium]|nr:ribonuclease R [Alphaproteobacteria bacterium]NCQ87425.1 ribonuclease R [Alphaproteobacteria bacterium]NCT06296.1 ribonuclease R [Alphaproteobacteria bacterium]
MSMPQIDEILAFIKVATEPQSKRELVRVFGIKGDDRKALKKMLRELEMDGKIVKGPDKGYTVPNSLPSVGIIQITKIDIDGDIYGVPLEWDEETQGPKPRVELLSNAPVKEGDRVLAKLKKFNDTLYEGTLIRRLDKQRATVMGQIVAVKQGFILAPFDKKAKYDFDVGQSDLGDAKSGDLVIAEIISARGLKRQKAKVTQVLGHRDDVNAISLIALHEAGLHEGFLDKVLDETKNLKVPPLKGKSYTREDLRNIPLVTIDGADARDFDDAVFAQRRSEAEGGGFHLIVAIADVAHYVRTKTALDNEAYNRGNSTYFPDRVVPMLPEALSNDLCSLRPHEDRACMAFHLWIDDNGNLTRHKIVRGLMRSHARLTYEQVQAARDGLTDDITTPLMNDVIAPLYDAYAVLDKARQKRGALDLDLPERQILIDDKGKMTGVKMRTRLDAHKLIEEFMILANVAAAQSLEMKNAPCVYRVHDRPSTEKLDSAREFLESFGLTLPSGIAKPAQINQLLQKAAKTDYSKLISTVILRTQSQAIYSPENIGHFGLALLKYGHFTSPIRRYADLLVHRSLIRAYKLGEGGLSEEEEVTLTEKADHISKTERNSADAERSAVDRFTAAWMSERIGAEFSGVISSVTRFGLFVSLDENGADGLIPMRTLPDDYYVHDEMQHALIGRRHKRIYRLGAKIQVRLKEADGMTGSSLFEVANDRSADIEGIQFKRSKIPDPPRSQKKGSFRDKKGNKKPGNAPFRKPPKGGGKPKKNSYTKKK